MGRKSGKRTILVDIEKTGKEVEKELENRIDGFIIFKTTGSYVKGSRVRADGKGL
ncbi:MAG: hypothetical protein LUH07_05570 [Lachnospiraceae bacterium]|nr:hypothetical protein [Lachnospiraceae bacterium]